MNVYDLPTSLEIGGIDYPIRTDFRAVIDVLISANDTELDPQSKAFVMLYIMFPTLENIPPELLQEALEKVCEFIDCGMKKSSAKQPRLLDWEQDAALIIPAINNVAHLEVRSLPYLHWWTFFGYFTQIGDCPLSTVVHIRTKKAKGQKFEQWEQEFYRENRSAVDFKSAADLEKEAVQKYFDKWL